ncbi:MAG TPA: transglycosylase domain-containing protein, partial [Cryptosporangiaceae bacterium]|nr:transglycosylase domain-containing protein [Cryptosporangiaceae bacterium]
TPPPGYGAAGYGRNPDEDGYGWHEPGTTGIGPRTRAAAALGADPRYGLPPGPPPKDKKARRKKILQITGLVTAAIVGLTMVTGGIAYASLDLPEIPLTKQSTVLYYAGGKAELGRLAVENREEVKLAKVPRHVQYAVLAAEDREFEQNSGVSARGTGRALLGLVTGDDKGGGSTITQQYVRNALDLTRERSVTRKAKEIGYAVKMAQQLSKEQILEKYLNTILFGRGAWGIQSASKAYFGKSVEKLTVAEGAVLAAVIKDPTGLEPETNPEGAKDRWQYVLDGMVEMSWLDQATAAKQTYPKLIPKNKASSKPWLRGSTGVLTGRIESELKDKVGLTHQQVKTGGLRVYTTIDQKAQAAAVKAAESEMKQQSKDMAAALVSVQPVTGKVVAYYGGNRGYGNLDLAGDAAPHPPGSSFKPFVLAKGIEEGYGIKSLWDGSSPQKFPDRAKPLRNSENDNSCGRRCSLTSATVKSLNTVYWALTLEVGAKEVARLAQKAGIKSLDGKPIDTFIEQGGLNSGIGIGQYSVSVLDQATGFATIAAYGQYAAPYFVERVVGPTGEVLYDHSKETKTPTRAFSEDTGRDTVYALEQVYRSGKKLKDGRPAAAKTGTQQYRNTDENSHAWMCGFTPQLATAVWVGSGVKTDIELRDKANGNTRVYGSGIPGRIWRAYMDRALAGAPERDFKEPKYIGYKQGNAPAPSLAPATPVTPTPAPDDDDDDLFAPESPTPTPSTTTTRCPLLGCPPDDDDDNGRKPQPPPPDGG